jgi:hypothetical protein
MAGYTDPKKFLEILSFTKANSSKIKSDKLLPRNVSSVVAAVSILLPLSNSILFLLYSTTPGLIHE